MKKYKLNPKVLSVGGTNNRIFTQETKSELDETCFINAEELVRKGFLIEIKSELAARDIIENVKNITDSAILIEMLIDEKRKTVIGAINERLEELK